MIEHKIFRVMGTLSTGNTIRQQVITSSFITYPNTFTHTQRDRVSSSHTVCLPKSTCVEIAFLRWKSIIFFSLPPPSAPLSFETIPPFNCLHSYFSFFCSFSFLVVSHIFLHCINNSIKMYIVCIL